MSGSARSLQMSMFSGLRVASTEYTPGYSKNGVNVNSKCVINAYLNIASKANGGKGRREVLTFTVWGGLADTCAKSMSRGKEFHCQANVHTYKGRGFYPGIAGAPGLPIPNPDGTQNMQKKTSFTITLLTFGEESNKHIANEIQAQLRPIGWNTAGHADQATWKEILKTRQATAFNAASKTFGYATVRLPQGDGISAYIPKTANAPAAPAAGVAAAFVGVNPAPTAVAPVVNEGGFIAAPTGV
jgi:hypothetical protein